MGGVLGAGNAVPMLEQFLAMYGGERMCIHPMDADYLPTAPEVYPTIEDALAAYPDHLWVFLDASAPHCLDELHLPADSVVFAAGHDANGFGDLSMLGRIRCQIRSLMPGVEGHAMIMLAAACAHYWERP